MIIQNFIVFEGGDGSGTTTQLNLLQDRLTNFPLYATFEPTDGHIGRLIRSALKREISLQPESLAHLFVADRNEHLFAPSGIVERAGANELVVSDRYVLSSLVYQGITCGNELAFTLNERFPFPEALFFFDVDPEIALERVEKRAEKEIYEYLDFQKLVRSSYKALLTWYEEKGVRVVVLDASQPLVVVAEDVWRNLKNLPILEAV